MQCWSRRICSIDPAAAPRTLVVVLNWNDAEDTLACLESLRTLDYPSFDVLVIDDGSRASVVPEVRRRFPRHRCVELPMNLGYAGGNNVGLREALARGYDFVWVLNNDTVIEPDALACCRRRGVHCLVLQPSAARCSTSRTARASG